MRRLRIVLCLPAASALTVLDCTGGAAPGGELVVANRALGPVTIISCGTDSCTNAEYTHCLPSSVAVGVTATLTLPAAQHFVGFVYNSSYEQECWPSEPGAFPPNGVTVPMDDPRQACESHPPPAPGGGCGGTLIATRQKIWKPSGGTSPEHSAKWNASSISVYPPAAGEKTATGYTIAVGPRGLNEFADPQLQYEYDALAVPFSHGIVDPTTGAPRSPSGGYGLSTTPLHEDWSKGLDPERFVVATDKLSATENVEIVVDTVDGKKQNVVKLTARTYVTAANASSASVVGDEAGPTVWEAALLQTAELYASGRYEIKAKVPRAQGLVWGVWTYHYENHWDAAHLPTGEVDSQFVPRASGWITKNNHEIGALRVRASYWLMHGAPAPPLQARGRLPLAPVHPLLSCAVSLSSPPLLRRNGLPPQTSKSPPTVARYAGTQREMGARAAGTRRI